MALPFLNLGLDLIASMFTSLNRPLHHYLNRRLNRYATAVASGGRRPRAKGGLLEICRYLEQALKISDRLAREDPHLFGPEAPAYFRETIAEHKWAVTIDAAVAQVYGAAATPPDTHRVWSQAYPVFHSAAEKQKWVKNWSNFRKQKSSF